MCDILAKGTHIRDMHRNNRKVPVMLLCTEIGLNRINCHHGQYVTYLHSSTSCAYIRKIRIIYGEMDVSV